MDVALGSFALIALGPLLIVLLVFFLMVWALSALVRAMRGGNRSTEDRRRTDSVLSDIHRGAARMDQRIASLETILLPEGRTNEEAR